MNNENQIPADTVQPAVIILAVEQYEPGIQRQMRLRRGATDARADGADPPPGRIGSRGRSPGRRPLRAVLLGRYGGVLRRRAGRSVPGSRGRPTRRRRNGWQGWSRTGMPWCLPLPTLQRANQSGWNSTKWSSGDAPRPATPGTKSPGLPSRSTRTCTSPRGICRWRL